MISFLQLCNLKILRYDFVEIFLVEKTARGSRFSVKKLIEPDM